MDGLTLVREFGCDEPMLEVSWRVFLHAYTRELSLGGELGQRQRTVGSVIEESGSKCQTYPVGNGESENIHQKKINTRGAEEEIASMHQA